jgi:hypothetical protein
MKRILIAAVTLMTGWMARAQSSNQVATTDYTAFRVISQRNIFDPSREPHRPGRGSSSANHTRTVDAFSLVGIMSYGKGDFAFFDGTNAEYRKILEPSGAIAGYKVAEIRPASVKLENGKQVVQMKVGTQMERNDESWRLAAQNELPATTASVAATTDSASEPAGDSSAGEPNDVLKKLMQQREQELK